MRLPFFGVYCPTLRGRERTHERAQRKGETEKEGYGGGSDREGELCPLIVQLSLSVMIKMR